MSRSEPESTRTWRDVCVAFAQAEGVAPELAAVLDAFRSPAPRGGPPPPVDDPFTGDFADLEREVLAAASTEAATLAAALAGEVDADQATMFVRRLRAVDEALAGVGDPTCRVLRVGLRLRTLGITRAPAPRALRLRAIADFYYSMLGRHRCARAGGPSIAALVEGARFSAVASGLELAILDGPSDAGPVHVNLLRADPARVRAVVHDCRAAVRAGSSFAETTRALGATAAVSGGFFLYSEIDIEAPSQRYDPVGLLLCEGELVSPPVFRRGGVLVDDRGQIAIARLGLEATTMHVGGQRLGLEAAWTRARARRGPSVRSVAIVGATVVAVGEDLAIPLNGFVVPTPPGLEIAVGERVEFGPIIGPTGRPLRSGVAGGPLLIHPSEPTLDMRGEDFWGSAPPVTFSQDETGDHNLLPRLAAGLDTRGRLVLAAIDGRNFERALGMTLADVAALMRALDCEVATNLDGGSSKRMVVQGETLDLSTTEIRAQASAIEASAVRPVHTALLLFADPE